MMLNHETHVCRFTIESSMDFFYSLSLLSRMYDALGALPLLPCGDDDSGLPALAAVGLLLPLPLPASLLSMTSSRNSAIFLPPPGDGSTRWT